MISVGQKLPEFNVKATASNTLNDNTFTEITEKSYAGKWKVLFFWPKDFTFVCPTEIAAFNDLYSDFDDRDTVLLGGSTDSEFVHLAWRQNKEE
ncbi:redoxin domain-containing protein, partial [Piscirickettsia salmonis]